MKPNLLEVRPGRIEGTVRVPPSKSVTHRAFLLAAQSGAPCTVTTPLLSDDTRATLSGLLAFGARFHLDTDRPEAIQFLPARLAAPRAPVDCRNSGTTLRLLAGLAARFGQPTTLTGDDSLRRRPNGDLLNALRGLGATVTDQAGRAPLTVQGPVRSGPVRLPGPTSSQFASSLLLNLPFVAGDSVVDMAPPVGSSPYLDVTLEMAARAGLRIVAEPAPGRRFRIAGNQSVNAAALAVDGDWSSAAVPLVAAAVTGGRITVTGLDAASRQGDRHILELLDRFGAKVTPTVDGATVEGAALHAPGNIDVAQTPDLFPILCVMAACSRGTTTFTGGAGLRGKETDRIAAMRNGLGALGAYVEEHDDGLAVTGGPLRGATVSSGGDHRIHMALAVAGLVAQGITKVDGPATAAVSYPGFHDDLARCGAGFTLLQGNRAVVLEDDS